MEMSEKIVLTVSDEHYGWLEEVRKRRGWGTIQDAVRSVIEDSYRLDKKIRNIDIPVSIIPSNTVSSDDTKSIETTGSENLSNS